MNSTKMSYKINHTQNNVIDQADEDIIYKFIFDYINKNSKKSLSTKEFYVRKYITLKNKKSKKNAFEGFEVHDSDTEYELNTLFPELFIIPFPQPKKPSFTFITLYICSSPSLDHSIIPDSLIIVLLFVKFI